MMKATSTERAFARRMAVEGVVGRRIEARRLARFRGVALHHRDGVEHFGGDGARIRHPILAGARKFAHPSSEPHARQHHKHQDPEHLHHHIRIGPDQHAQRADGHHRIAQAHAQGRTDHRLDQRGVGGEARQDFAGLRGFEERRTLPQHMRVHRIAEVGCDSLAEPAHGIETRRGKHAQRHRHREQQEEVVSQFHRLRAAIGRDESAVDQLTQRQRKSQRRASRKHQEQAGQRNLQPVGTQERKQSGEGFGCAFGGVAGDGFGHPPILSSGCRCKGRLDSNCLDN